MLLQTGGCPFFSVHIYIYIYIYIYIIQNKTSVAILNTGLHLQHYATKASQELLNKGLSNLLVDIMYSIVASTVKVFLLLSKEVSQ